MGDQLSLLLAPVTTRVYQPRGINALQRLFKEHFQSFADQHEAKHAIIYGRFRIERITEVVEESILCGDYSQGIARLHLVKVAENSSQMTAGTLLALIMALALAMVPVMMFPVSRRHNEVLALGYVVFRGGVETAIYVAIAITRLLLLIVGLEYVRAGAPDASHFQTLGALFLQAHDSIDPILGIVFPLGALMLYSVFYQSRLIPRWLSGWGLAAAVLWLATALFAMYGLIRPMSAIQNVLALPIGLQEMVMAVWLIVKGFNPSAIVSGSDKVDSSSTAGESSSRHLGLTATLVERPLHHSLEEVLVHSRKFLKAVGLGAVLVAAVLLGACTTTNLGNNKTGWSDYATIAIKDYTVVGIVRVTSEEIKKRSIFGFVDSHKGSQITYDMLIKEAKALGADDIINVRIDRADESVHIPILEWLIGYTEKYSYIGNALAIKYKDAQSSFPQSNQAGSSGMGGGPISDRLSSTLLP